MKLIIVCVENIIVDTNLYTDDFVKKLTATNVVRVLVYAPLKLLLERDEQRTHVLQRSGERAHDAKQFVFNTYEYYYTRDQQLGKKLVARELEENVYSRFDFDVCINTQNIATGAIMDVVKSQVTH